MLYIKLSVVFILKSKNLHLLCFNYSLKINIFVIANFKWFV